MNKFRRLGFIEYNGGEYSGGIEVHSSLLNVVLYDQPPNQDLKCAHFAAARACREPQLTSVPLRQSRRSQSSGWQRTT
jgi:hypothetical protein